MAEYVLKLDWGANGARFGLEWGLFAVVLRVSFDRKLGRGFRYRISQTKKSLSQL
jgi:hypothetical protein